MYSLDSYQKEGLKYCLSVQHPALLWSMRLSKTLVIIRWLKILNKWPILIMCPNSAIAEWVDQLIGENLTDILKLLGKNHEERLEILRKCIPDLFVSSAHFDGKHTTFTTSLNLMADRYNTNPEIRNRICIINHDGYISLPEIGRFPWKVVILDESHIIRNLGAKGRNRFTRFCLANFRQAEHRSILTGTVMPENEIDIFNQLAFLSSDHIKPYKNFWDFRNKCFDYIDFKYLIRPEGSRWIKEKLKLCSVKEYVDVGVKDRLKEEIIYVDLPEKIREQYDRLFREFILSNEWVEKATISSGARYVWMRQLIGGFVEGKLVHDVKIKAISSLLKASLKNKQVIIWSRFNSEVEAIANILQCSFINGLKISKIRQYVISTFKDENHSVLSANPYCFAHGGNLSVANAEIYYSLPESGLIFNQSKRRIFDIRQMQDKTCYYIIARNTLDEVILDAHKRKVSVSKAIFEYARKEKQNLQKERR